MGKQGSLALLLLSLYTFFGRAPAAVWPPNTPSCPADFICWFTHLSIQQVSVAASQVKELRLEPNTSDEHQGEGEEEDNGDRGTADDGQGDRVGLLEEVLNLLGWQDRWVVRVEPREGALGHWVGCRGAGPGGEGTGCLGEKRAWPCRPCRAPSAVHSAKEKDGCCSAPGCSGCAGGTDRSTAPAPKPPGPPRGAHGPTGRHRGTVLGWTVLGQEHPGEVLGQPWWKDKAS